jgi:hypothetical protein
MREAWPVLREPVERISHITGPWLERGDKVPPAAFDGLAEPLSIALEMSEVIRREAEEALADASGVEYDEAALLLLAAATVDAMIASDVALADPGPELAPWADVFDPAARDERQDTLRDADAAFAGGMDAVSGGATPPDRAALTADVHGSVDRLVGLATPAEGEVLSALLSVATGGLAGPVLEAMGMEQLPVVEGIADGVRRFGPAFLREYALKIATLPIVESISHKVGHALSTQPAARGLLARIAEPEQAKEMVTDSIASWPEIAAGRVDSLKTDLGSLESGLRPQMKFVGRSARWIRRGGGPLSHVLAPVGGPVVLVAVLGLAGCYVVYSLTDRLDAVALGWADRIVGVVPLAA